MAATKHPLLRVKTKHNDVTIGPSAIGIALVVVVGALVAAGAVSMTDVVAALPKLPTW